MYFPNRYITATWWKKTIHYRVCENNYDKIFTSKLLNYYLQTFLKLTGFKHNLFVYSELSENWAIVHFLVTYKVDYKN